MADKKKKKTDRPEVGQQTQQASGSQKSNRLSDVFADTLQSSLTDFSKLSEEQRTQLYGQQAFLDQFRAYCKKEYPSLRSLIKQEDLPGYLELLEKKGFTIAQLSNQGDQLHREFAPSTPEREVMQSSLQSLDRFCKENINAMPAGIFNKFADVAGFDHTTYAISPKGSLQMVDDLYIIWKQFLENENITLKENQKKNIEHILCPDYDPVERVVVQIAIDKIKKTLPSALKQDFDRRFPTPITAFSSLQSLAVFKSEWLMFLEIHQADIDQSLAKKLDSIIVTNADIRQSLVASSKRLDSPSSYTEREKYFSRVFDKLATRQLFEEVKEREETINGYMDVIASAAKGFPPYMNEIFMVYPYNDALVARVEPALSQQIGDIDVQIEQIEMSITHVSSNPQEQLRLRKKRKALLQEKELIRRKAYIRYLETKDRDLANVMDRAVSARFELSTLSAVDQQIILNHLVKHKLHDLIQHKAPELLDLDRDALQQFVDDLFDLQKMDIMIPTIEGMVPLHFTEKAFVAQASKSFLAVNDLANIKTLPLQFSLAITPANQDFFEKGILRGPEGGQLFDTFQSADGPRIVHDGYKINLSKNGQTVTGYLSPYPPAQLGAKDAEITVGDWYLYSQPITQPSQEREVVTRPDGTYVSIPENQESDYHLEVVDKSFTLTGQAIGSLIFAYILGQQSRNNIITPTQEKELAKKIKKLDTFLDIQQSQPDDESGSAPSSTSTESKEKTEYQKFLDAWKALPGYNFPADQKDFGFKEGSRIYIKAGESALPPMEVPSDAWMYLEIKKIDPAKGIFTTTIHGGEFGLGSLEGGKRELPLTEASLDKVKEVFGSDIYKVPSSSGVSFDEQLNILKQCLGKAYDDRFAYTFDAVKSHSDGFVFAQGDFIGEKVAGFGYDAKVPEYSDSAKRTIEKIVSTLFTIKRTPEGNFRVECNRASQDEKGNSVPPFSRVMDPMSFALFIAGKKLQPKTSSEVLKQKNLQTKEDSPDKGFNQRFRGFSINNMLGFFKTNVNKIKDSIKKYDDERTEDMTDVLLQNGNRFIQFGKFRSGLSGRVGESFENAGMEYYTTRDARIRKKIEKRQKFYEQEKHYPSFFYHSLNDMITGKEVPKDMYKIPAMLLAIINKEKSPYARHYDLIGKGHRVNMILGKEHQTRYLGIMNQKIHDLRQNSDLYGTERTIHRNEEIIKLEMKYIVDIIDMREHGIVDQEDYQSSKWSRTFAEKLDESMRTKFGDSGIQEKYNALKTQNVTFEFAEYEYSRHTRTGKPDAAFPFLKKMAEQAQTSAQRQLFEMHVVSSTLSGWFLYATDAKTKGWIKDICRSRGFIPGLFAKDINQQTKMLSLINIFLKSKGQKFEDFPMVAQKGAMANQGAKPNFSLNNYTLGNMSATGWFVADGFKTRWLKDNNGKKFSKFLEVTGKDAANKYSLLELLDSPDLSNAEKAILKEYISLTNESSQDLDPDVKHNFQAVAGTPFTKCETIVKELLKYDDGEFDGKDSHEKAGPAMFWDGVASGLPKERTSSDKLHFFIGKFFNRFDGYGFADGNQKTDFLKRLMTIRNMFTTHDPKLQKQAEDMLRYTINGIILQRNSSGKGTPPPQLEKALDAFRIFFKANIDAILSPSTISLTMGDFYAKDTETNTSYSVGDWSEYVMIKNPAAMIGDATNREISKKYNSASYMIYPDLYNIAEDLAKGKGQTNRFKKYYNRNDASSTTTASQTNSQRPSGGIAVTNPLRAKELGDTLHNKPPKKPLPPQYEDDQDSLFTVLRDEN